MLSFTYGITSLIFDVINKNREEILTLLSSGKIIGKNPHGGMTRYFDRAIEELLIRNLREKGYKGNIVGEELGINRGITNEWIYIDPLDGSNNVVRKIEYYCTAVAYAEGGRIEDIKSAVVWDIPRDIFYVAEKAGGAKKIEGGKATKIIPKREYDIIILDAGFTTKGAYLKEISKIGTFRRLGSIILSSMKVAEGLLEGIFDVNNLRATDVAAAYLILWESGAYAYVEPKEIYENPRVKFIAAKNREIYDILMQIYKKYKD